MNVNDIFYRRNILIETMFPLNKNNLEKTIKNSENIFKKQMHDINKLFSKNNIGTIKINEVAENLKKYNRYIGKNLLFPISKVVLYPDEIKNDIEIMYSKIEKLSTKEFEDELVKKLRIGSDYKKTIKGIYDLATEYFYDDVFIEECINYDPKILVDYYNNKNKIQIMLQKNEAIYMSRWETISEQIDKSNKDSIINIQKLIQVMMESNKATVKVFKKAYGEVISILTMTHSI